MMPFLFLVFLLGAAVQEGQPSVTQARILGLHDLPQDIALPFRDNGFTVVAITFINNGAQPVTIDAAKVRVLDPKNKPLVAATSSEVTPKMVKSGARVPNAPAPTARPPFYGPGYPGYGRPLDPGVSVGGGSGGGTLDIGRVERLKATIEKYQLKSTDVLPGEKTEGFLYLKTDQDPDKLKGTRILLNDEITLTVE
jgi:hypothetical protein